MREFFLISYHFPPSTAIGGRRIHGFAKYLPLVNWKSCVLTVDERYIINKDSSLLGDIRHVEIYRTMKMPELLQKIIKMAGKGKKQGGKKGLTHCIETNSLSNDETTGIEQRVTLLFAIKRFILAVLLELPDAERKWILPAIAKGLRIIRKKRIRFMMTTSPPASTHLIGLALRWLAKVTWVADFRDPWSTPFFNSVGPRWTVSRRINAFLEKVVVKEANLITVNTKPLREALRAKYLSENSEKFQFIPNGIDYRYFGKLDSTGKYPTFTIVYAGSFYSGRTAEPVFSAIEQLKREKRIEVGEIKVKLFGMVQQMRGKQTEELIRSYGLEAEVDLYEEVPYRKALEMIAKSHLGLIIAIEQPYQIPGKIYDYLGAGVRILALTEAGATAELVHCLEVGRAIPPDDIDQIKSFIEYERTRNNVVDFWSDKRDRFDITKHTAKLAQLVERL